MVLEGIVYAVLSGDLFKGLDIFIRDLNVGDSGILTDELLHRLLAVGICGGLSRLFFISAKSLMSAAFNTRPVIRVVLTARATVLFSTSSCMKISSFRDYVNSIYKNTYFALEISKLEKLCKI